MLNRVKQMIMDTFDLKLNIGLSLKGDDWQPNKVLNGIMFIWRKINISFCLLAGNGSFVLLDV